MKKLIRIVWVRRSIQALLVIVSLLFLASASASWWAAGEKQEAIKKLESEGNLVESAKFKRPMPPDSENFAMIPLMVKLREQEARSTDIPGDGIGAKLYELGLDQRKAPFKLPSKGEPLDLSVVSEKLALTGTAGEMLEQFDLRHHEVLAGLREGMGRVQAVLPERFDPSNPREAFTGTSGGLMRFRVAAAGLAVRAELAFAAGRSEVALESVLMTRRLSDLAFSENTTIAKLVAWNLDHDQVRMLKKGIDARAWDGAQLEAIQNAWGRRDTKDATARTLNFEGVALAILFDHSKRDRHLMIDVTTGDKDFLTRLQWEATPDAWFDANSAGILNRTGRWLEVIRKDQPLQSWWDASAAFESEPKDWLDQLVSWGGFGEQSASAALIRFGSRAIVDDALVRLACLLAEHREAHGSFPPSLDVIGGDAIIDPLTGKPFVYRPEGVRFVLYSIGPDGIDDGGEERSAPKGSYCYQSDWVWREAR